MKRNKEKTILPIIDIKKYGGKQIAIWDGKIIATAHNLKELISKIKMDKPSCSLSEIHIFSVPKTLTVIYCVKN